MQERRTRESGTIPAHAEPKSVSSTLLGHLAQFVDIPSSHIDPATVPLLLPIPMCFEHLFTGIYTNNDIPDFQQASSSSGAPGREGGNFKGAVDFYNANAKVGHVGFVVRRGTWCRNDTGLNTLH